MADIFSLVQGKTTEPLASAVLCYLMQESPVIRGAVLRAFNGAVAQKPDVGGPLTANRRFAAQLEIRAEPAFFDVDQPVETDEVTGEKGFLDILVETDDAVVGIENKFWAQFQEGQPKKYAPTVAKAVRSLEEIPGSQISRGLLVVLAPRVVLAQKATQGRIDETNKSNPHKISGSDFFVRCVPVAWEDVLREITEIDAPANLSPVVVAILEQFRAFLKSTLDLEIDLLNAYPFLRGTPVNTQQYDFLQSLKSVFPGSKKVTPASRWVGLSFYELDFSDEQEFWGWVGFVDSSMIASPEISTGTELIVQLGMRSPREGIPTINGLSKSFVPCEIPNWAGDAFWRVEFDASWASKEKWRMELEPFWNHWHPADDS